MSARSASMAQTASAPRTAIAQPSRKQALENGMFVRALRQTGNITMAASMIGMHRTTFMKRRRRFPGFAADMDAAIAAAHAALKLAGGANRLPEPPTKRPKTLRTIGDEIVVHAAKGRRMQLRRSLPGKMTKAAEQAFFRALSATANVRMSCAAVGFSQGTVYRRRKMDVVFAGEMQAALEIGYDRLQMAMIERATGGVGTDGHDEQAWRDWVDVDNPVPAMSIDQMLQLLYYHRSTAVLKEQRYDRKAKKPDIEEVKARIMGMVSAIKRGSHYRETGEWRFDHETPPPELPPLEQVTGWSAADPKRAKHHPEVALFGGWRIEDMKAKMEAKGINRRSRRTNDEIWEEKTMKRERPRK